MIFMFSVSILIAKMEGFNLEYPYLVKYGLINSLQPRLAVLGFKPPPLNCAPPETSTAPDTQEWMPGQEQSPEIYPKENSH